MPLCACGGPWKPATISFGQSLVAADLQRAMREAAECDLFVAAGTSLVVGPINQMFATARSAGALTAILTASETPFDDVADGKLGEPLQEVLPALARAILEDGSGARARDEGTGLRRRHCCASPTARRRSRRPAWRSCASRAPASATPTSSW